MYVYILSNKDDLKTILDRTNVQLKYEKSSNIQNYSFGISYNGGSNNNISLCINIKLLFFNKNPRKLLHHHIVRSNDLMSSW